VAIKGWKAENLEECGKEVKNRGGYGLYTLLKSGKELA
jgi:hypothetical protein